MMDKLYATHMCTRVKQTPEPQVGSLVLHVRTSRQVP